MWNKKNKKKEEKGFVFVEQDENKAIETEIAPQSSISQLEDTTISANDNDVQDILKRLDLQLFLSVMMYFLTAWFFLYNKIVNFTGVEPYNVQMCYIFVHYILSVTLIFCLCLTAVKSYLMINTNQSMNWLIKLFSLFLESWYWILGICFSAIIFSGSFKYEWVFFTIILFAYLIIKMKDLEFNMPIVLITVASLFYGFFLFVSSMTSITREVEIETDKPFYSFSDKVLITVNARGYACSHKLIGLGEQYKGVKYYSDKGLIVLNATQIKNNEIAIATVSPSAEICDFFWLYPWKRIVGKDYSYIDISPNDMGRIKEYCDFTPKSVYVKP